MWIGYAASAVIILYFFYKKWEKRDVYAVQHVNDGVLLATVSPDMELEAYKKVNKVICEKLGYREEQILHMPPLHIVHPDDRKNLREAIRNTAVEKVNFCYCTYISKGGTRLAAEVTLRLVKQGRRNEVLFIVRDLNPVITAKKQMEKAQLWYDSLFQYNLDTVFSLDEQGRFTSINPAGVKIIGYTEEEILQMLFMPLIVPEDIERTLYHFGKALEGEPQNLELTIINKYGTRIELQVTTVPTSTDNNVTGLIGIAKDITERKRIERRLRESEQRYRSLFQYNLNAIVSTDLEGNFTSLNPASEKLSGYSIAELSGMNFLSLVIEEEREAAAAYFQKALRGKPQNYHVTARHKNDGYIYLEVSSIPIWVDEQVVGAYGIIRDITKQRKAEEKIQFMAFHDPLTKLPNRRLLRKRLHEALAKAKNENSLVAIMYLDLDRFKLVNDTLGHSIGDLLLKEAAKRLKGCLCSSDTISRQGGDEFIILLQQVTEHETKEIASRIIRMFKASFYIEGREIFVTPSIGISFYPFHGRQADTLLKKADIAMHYVKEQGKNNYHIYSPELDEKSHEKFSIQTALHKALERQEFVLYYQPKIDTKNNVIIGAEALLRWKHPVMGVVSPQKFIPIAEETGLIIPIGEWVLREACLQNKRWQQAGFPPIIICVNLSMRQFYQPDFVAKIVGILEETGLAPEYLEVEITESIAMEVEKACHILQGLKSIGVKIAIDDFGTGYSSLNRLKNFQMDHLKIDQSFVRSITNSKSGRGIIKAIISMAHNLGLSVVAEGVETEEELAFLKEQNCYEAQGYLFSPPVPSSQFEAMLGVEKNEAT
ncbi:MAG: EAL domain-containing protein [Ectobacillus sp.]